MGHRAITLLFPICDDTQSSLPNNQRMSYFPFFAGSNRLVGLMYDSPDRRSEDRSINDQQDKEESGGGGSDGLGMTVALAAAFSAALLVMAAAAALVCRYNIYFLLQFSGKCSYFFNSRIVLRRRRRTKGSSSSGDGRHGPNGYTLASTGKKARKNYLQKPISWLGYSDLLVIGSGKCSLMR